MKVAIYGNYYLNSTEPIIDDIFFFFINNNVEMIKLLISKGADVNEKDQRGNTATKYAELSNATEAFDFLKNLKK